MSKRCCFCTREVIQTLITIQVLRLCIRVFKKMKTVKKSFQTFMWDCGNTVGMVIKSFPNQSSLENSTIKIYLRNQILLWHNLDSEMTHESYDPRYWGCLHLMLNFMHQD